MANMCTTITCRLKTIAFVILTGLCTETSLAMGTQEMLYKQDGDYVIGALLALRSYDEKSQTCTNITDVGAVRRAESIAYAVTKINKDPNILKNVTLGYEIYDTCYTRSVTLKHVLSFTKRFRERDNVVGVVGTTQSSTSEISTILLSLYNVTMISHLATSDELGNRDRYPFFMRTVPPNSLQIDAIIDILMFYDWKYVAFIYTETIYGSHAYDYFRKRLTDTNLGICVPYERGMTVTDGEAVFIDMLDQLENFVNRSLLSVVILFTELENAKRLLKTANDRKVQRRFIWIASDSFGIPCLDTVENVEEAALGAFTLISKAAPSPEFEDHFKSELNNDGSNNPWIKEYKPGITSCPAFERHVIDAVEWLARGLDELLTKKCGTDIYVSCNRTNLLELNRNFLRDILLNVSLDSSDNKQFFFPQNGRPLGSYEIRQLVKEKGRFKYKTVGSWSSNEGLTMDKNITWYLTNKQTFSKTGIPKSSCREPCLSHQRRILSEYEPCCWTCESCNDDQIVVMNGTVCKSCIDKQLEEDVYMWPSQDKQICSQVEELAILKQANAIILMSVSVLGFVFSSIVAYLYVKHRNKRIIRASSRELGYVILTGVFINYLAAIIYRTRATIYTCSCQRFMSHVATSLIYVSIATITIRLYRIFMAGKTSAQRPRFISPKSQIIVTLSLSLIPFTWAIIWMIKQPPSIMTIEPSKEKQFIQKICDPSIPNIAGQLVWNVVVLLVCCVFAFRARNLPANYNQSRFIAFCVFGALVVDMSFAPALFSSSDPANIGIYLSLGAIIHSSIVIILIFAVRVYAVYYVDTSDTSQDQPSNQQSHSTSNVLLHQDTAKTLPMGAVAVKWPISKSM